MDFSTAPASDYPVTDLVEIINRGFENYIIPITLNLTMFLNMVRKDGIDLTASRVLLGDSNPIGLALIARRGWTSRVAAMGIAQEARGCGAGFWFMEQLIDEARQRGDREMILEVIEQNTPAVRLYEKCGFETMRRLIGLLRKDASETEADELQEIDIREAARRLSQHGMRDLPWQSSAESIACTTPPARAYASGPSCIVVSNPDAKDVVVWSLFVDAPARGNGLGSHLLRSVIAHHPGKTWHVPAVLPEELGKTFEAAGFQREEMSQWQMRLRL